jgi:hypothetical protein
VLTHIKKNKKKQGITPDKGGNIYGGTHSSELRIQPPEQLTIEEIKYPADELKKVDRCCVLFNLRKQQQKNSDFEPHTLENVEKVENK